VAAAAAAALLVGAGVLVQRTSNDRVRTRPPAGPASTTTTTRPPLPAGLIGLPAEGAAPSTPETGQLLATLPIPIWVYEDGRVISARWTTYDDWTGYLEQRLTPEGVELVRAEILALGPLEECRTGAGNYGYADGSRIVGESPGNRNLCGNLSQYQRLSELQYGAPSWLPASAWADPVPKPYVPSTYQFQISPAADVPAMLEDLPSEAAELLTRSTECGFLANGSSWVCFEVSTEEARQVAATLGISQPPYGYPWAITWEGQFGFYHVVLLPYLPHHAPVWCCGG
jgi:hypothetical protein